MKPINLVALFGMVLMTASLVGAGNGGKPPVELSNNLSVPAVSETMVGVAPYWEPPTDPETGSDVSVLGDHYSYGCDKPENWDQWEYPNTSCVSDLMAEEPVYYNAQECTAAGGPCEGFDVYRIYWQKVPVNAWWAEADAFDDGEISRSAAYVDWGDGLEVVSWNERSVIRVETQPYGSLMVDANGFFDPMAPDENGVRESCEEAALRLGLDDPCRVAFQMWHVSGQGTTEKWGVRATDPGDGTAPLPYVYESPFQIIHTYNAMLTLSKLDPDTATCPDPGSPDPFDPPPEGPFSWNGSGWDGACTYLHDPYTVELSVTGKYVYGHNWRMKEVEFDHPESPCPGWSKTGYWRLTFSTTTDAVLFDPFNPVLETAAPPPMPTEPTLPPFEDDSAPLYTPVVDDVNNLTYIDICIKEKVRGRDRE